MSRIEDALAEAQKKLAEVLLDTKTNLTERRAHSLYPIYSLKETP